MAQTKIYETIISTGPQRFVFYAYNDLGSAEAKIHALKVWDDNQKVQRIAVVRHRAIAHDTSDGPTCIAPDVALEDFVARAGEYIILTSMTQ